MIQGYQRIIEMLRMAGSEGRLFPATILYNEGWLLRLVLDWFSGGARDEHPLQFLSGSRWFSEALLASQFFGRDRKDKLAEGYTHADGVIGHLGIGSSSLADAKLERDATQFVVTEAKLFSPLSPGVKHAPYYDQAARNVACIAHLLSEAGRRPEHMRSLGFFVLAPEIQISTGVFGDLLTKASIRNKVWRRVSEYTDERRKVKEEWFKSSFLPTLEAMRVSAISWEDIIMHISGIEGVYGAMELKDFYERCLEFNRVQERE